MNRLAWTLLPALALAAVGGTARADVLSLRLEGHGGGGAGTGLGGAAKDKDFFKSAAGIDYGGLVGLEILFVDVWVEHHQFVTPSEFKGTWTQFMVGLDLDLTGHAAATPDEKKKHEQGKQTSYMEIGLGVGYGVGTGRQVSPPLDAGQVSDKGFQVQGRFSAGFWMGGHAGLGFGITVPVEGGYYFKQGFANMSSNQYYGVEGAVLLVVRGEIKIK